jgi:hypothetical protein
MILSEGLATLELTMTSSGTTPRVIHPTLLWDDENVILVDTGVPGQLQAIREAMDKLGVPFRRLNKVIITHQDLDHIGSLPEVLKAADPAPEVIAHELAKPYIEGDKLLVIPPVGKFVPVYEPDKHLICIAGGSGVTPFRGFVREATRRELETKITILYSVRTTNDIIFNAEFRELAQANKNFNFYVTCTRLVPEDPWTGRRGRTYRSQVSTPNRTRRNSSSYSAVLWNTMPCCNGVSPSVSSTTLPPS